MLAYRNLLLRRTLFRFSPKFSIGHIRDLDDQIEKRELEEIAERGTYLVDAKVYKPSYTIPFDRNGECLLYSADVIKGETIYFKYPTVLYESYLPFAIAFYLISPLNTFNDANWVNVILWSSALCFFPRHWDWQQYSTRVKQIYLMRGGRNVTLKFQSLANDRHVAWSEIHKFKPLTADKQHFLDVEKDDFLDEKGQLTQELNLEFSDIMLQGVNANNQILKLIQRGTVHEPEIFEAVVRGYNIDTNDFIINTVDNYRAHDGNHDQ